MQYLLFVGTVTYDSLSKDDKADVVLLSSYFLFLQQVNPGKSGSPLSKIF